MRFPVSVVVIAAASVVLSVAHAAGRDDSAAQLGEVEVTATKSPEPVDRVPAQITVITGEELRARGANDLRTALLDVVGVDSPPGGDAGPASAVPSIWGLHEFDAFLLVVDGVPLGGAFNPSIATLNLNDVERIEVLKGAAPVVYGATAFVGVIQVIHYKAGEASQDANVGYGSYGSGHVNASLALPSIGEWKQSLSASGERVQYKDNFEGINDGKFLYRGGANVLGGYLRLDGDATIQHQSPSSPLIRQDRDIVNPVDSNFNPSNAHIDEDRYHFVLGYDHETLLGNWSNIVSYSHTNISDKRGFLRPDFNDPAAEPDEAGDNSDYQNQDRGILDLYFDSHFAKTILPNVNIVYGADFLYGSGKQQSTNGAYCAGGTQPPYNCGPDQPGPRPQKISERPVDEINGTDDRREFIGEYLQVDWRPDPRLTLLGGVRLNETAERKTSTHIDTADDTANTDDRDKRNNLRISGTVGASYQVWRHGADEAVLYVDYRNQFKPAAIDFGPDVTPDVLKPEKSQSVDGGVKGHLAGGRLDYDINYFYLDFKNLVVPTVDAGGGPILVNAGSSTFQGIEVETKYHFYRDAAIGANYSYHHTRFGNFEAEDGASNFRGNQRSLAPHTLGSLGFYYDARQGLRASLVAAYVGDRYLDDDNTATAPSYVTLDGSLGYRYRIFRLTVNGYNLTDERKPVTNSEFGPESFYFLPGRSVFVNLGIDLLRL